MNRFVHGTELESEIKERNEIERNGGGRNQESGVLRSFIRTNAPLLNCTFITSR